MHDYYLFLHMEMVCMQFIFLFLEGGHHKFNIYTHISCYFLSLRYAKHVV